MEGVASRGWGGWTRGGGNHRSGGMEERMGWNSVVLDGLQHRSRLCAHQ